MRTFRKGGIHPPENKNTHCPELRHIIPGADIRLMMSQSIGAPAKPIVKAGDHVERFDIVAEAGGFVSAPIHSPVSGTVKKIDRVRNAQGYWDEAIIITPDSTPEIHLDDTPETPGKAVIDARLAEMSKEEIINVIGSCGVVGLGGATFPTKVKFLPPEGMTPEVLIINGAECEPYLTCDDTLMRRRPIEIIAGVRFMMKAAAVSRAIVGIEANKPDSIKALKEAAADYPEIAIEPLKTKYPQGGEKQLIFALTGKEVPTGALPVATGAIVDNVATVYAVFQAAMFNRPLVERIVTVNGPEVSDSGNFVVPFGVSLDEVIEAAGGMPADTGKVLAGGPMMGRAVSHTDAPAVKGLSGLVLLPENQSHRLPYSSCIRCAACVEACPMGLEPYLIERLVRFADTDSINAAGAMSCIECGSCNYSCPSNRPLLDRIRLGKRRVGDALKAKKK